MSNGKDDVLRAILEIRKMREAKPAARQPESEGPSSPVQSDRNTSRGQLQGMLLVQLASNVTEQSPAPAVSASPPVTSEPVQTVKVAEVATPETAPSTMVRVCPTSVSGNHQWVYPTQRRGAGDIHCRHCGQRKGNR